MSAEGPPEALCPSRVCRQHRLNRRENPGGSARSPCSAGTQAETNRSIGSGCINDRGHLPRPRGDFIRFWVALQQPGEGLPRQGVRPVSLPVTSCSGLSEGQSHGPLPGLLMQEWGPRSGGCLLPGAQCHRGGAAGERPTALATVSEGCVRAPQRHRGGLRVTTAPSAGPQHPSHSLRAGPQGALSRGRWTSLSPLWRADRCTVSCRSWHHRWGAGGPLEGSQQPTTRFQEHPPGISLASCFFVTLGW